VSCASCASGLEENVAKKYHKEIAGKLKIALTDETKMQELIHELDDRGYSKAVDTLERSSSAYGTTSHCLYLIKEGSRQLTDWRGSIRS
jgi:hypothetical protein